MLVKFLLHGLSDFLCITSRTAMQEGNISEQDIAELTRLTSTIPPELVAGIVMGNLQAFQPPGSCISPLALRTLQSRMNSPEVQLRIWEYQNLIVLE
jgi:hypothetical protein